MPDSQVVVVMREYKAALLRGEQSQMQEMARRWLAVERRLAGQMEALAWQMNAIKRDGGTVSRELLMNEQRYRELMAQLTKELEGYSDYAERTIEDRQRQLARLGVRHAQDAIRTQGVGAGFNRLPIEAVENMVGLAGNGSPLRILINQSWPLSADGLTQQLIDGVALGYNPRKTARLMAQGMTGSLDRMMVIARTEQLRVYRQANRDSYRASGVVGSYKRLATHDDRVCAACLMDEGTVYDVGEEMPEHPQGRCAMVPVVDGVPNPQWKQGREWFEEQDVSTQKAILGKGRFYAWQNGDFDLGELVTVKPNATWGPSIGTTPLGKLGGAGQVVSVGPVAPVMALGKMPPVIGDVHPEILRVFQEEFEIIAREYPFLRDYVKSMNFSGEAGGSSFGADFDFTDKSLRFGRTVAKMSVEEYERDNQRAPGFLVGGSSLRNVVIHEVGHAIDTYVRIGVGPFSVTQDSYLSEIEALKRKLPSPSTYAEKNIREWVAERFTAERLSIGDDELQNLFRRYIPSVDEGNFDPKPKKRKTGK